MRRLILIVFSILLSILITGCLSTQGHKDNPMPVSSNSAAAGSDTPASSVTPVRYDALISGDILTNTSVNIAWEGRMCEANGFIYYVSATDSKAQLIRMNPDGSNPAAISDKFSNIIEMTADNDHIYFVEVNGGTGTIFSMPLEGGEAQEVARGNVRSLQYMKGRLYWIDNRYESPTIKIMSVNPDGSDLKPVITLAVSRFESHAEFLATETGIYYSRTNGINSDYTNKDNIYHTDLSGENQVKLNRDPLRSVDKLFYDQGEFYFLMQNDFNDDPFSESVMTFDKDGNTTVILDHVGYFPQDFACVFYCGISDGIIYYFIPQPLDGSSAHILLNLYQYDIDNKKNDLILSDVDMGDSAVGKLTSLRGKSMDAASVGMYILGNDIYFETFQMP